MENTEKYRERQKSMKKYKNQWENKFKFQMRNQENWYEIQEIGAELRKY